MGHFESVQAIVGKRSAIVKIDWAGNVIDTWYNIDGTLSGISEAVMYKNQLYLGSPYNKYIGRVPIPGANAESVILEQPKMQEPPKVKPTEAPTTTQKPATKKPEPPKTTQPPTKPPTQATKPPTQPTKPTQASPTTPPPTPKSTQVPKTAKPTKKSTPPPTKVPKDGKNTDSTKPTPIIEDIPSDTMPPKKEHLKVIKKDGPSEMPHPDTVKVEKPAKTKPAQNKNEL